MNWLYLYILGCVIYTYYFTYIIAFREQCKQFGVTAASNAIWKNLLFRAVLSTIWPVYFVVIGGFILLKSENTEYN